MVWDAAPRRRTTRAKISPSREACEEMGTVPAAGKIMSNRLRRETDSSENPLSNVLGITVQPEQLQTAAAAKRRREP